MRWIPNGPTVVTVGFGCPSNHGPRKIPDRETRKGRVSVFDWKASRFRCRFSAKLIFYDEADLRLGMDEFGIIEAGVHLTGDADGDGDGDVDADDRAAVNDALGLCAANIDGDGMIDAFDLAAVLGYWGLCSWGLCSWGLCSWGLCSAP